MQSDKTQFDTFVRECRKEFARLGIGPNYFTKDCLHLIFNLPEDNATNPQVAIARFKEHYFEVFFAYNRIPKNSLNQEAIKEFIKTRLTCEGKLIGFTKGKKCKHERVVYRALL